MLRSIAIYPSFNREYEIQRVRNQFDHLADVVRHHATLVFPFDSALSTEDLRIHMKSALQNMHPFRLTLGSPLAVGNTVQIPVVNGACALTVMHDRLYSGILRSFLREDIPYRPHVTVGRELDPDNRRSCIQAASVLSGASGLATEIACEIIGNDESSNIEIVCSMPVRSTL